MEARSWRPGVGGQKVPRNGVAVEMQQKKKIGRGEEHEEESAVGSKRQAAGIADLGPFEDAENFKAPPQTAAAHNLLKRSLVQRI